MEQDIIFLAPAFQERIWGGKKLQSIYGYDIPHEQTGEAWVISAHEHGPSLVLNGALKGKTLRTAWEQYPALFGQASGEREFPLLVKIIDANEDRKSTRLNSSHVAISYAVFCLKKKNKTNKQKSYNQ